MPTGPPIISIPNPGGSRSLQGVQEKDSPPFRLPGIRTTQDKYEKLLTNPELCSHIIAIILKRSTEIAIPEMEEIAAVACAVQNIWLSAAAFGLGGYWSTGGITYDPAARPFLGLQGDDRLMGFFYLGYIQIPSV